MDLNRWLVRVASPVRPDEQIGWELAFGRTEDQRERAIRKPGWHRCLNRPVQLADNSNCAGTRQTNDATLPRTASGGDRDDRILGVGCHSRHSGADALSSRVAYRFFFEPFAFFLLAAFFLASAIVVPLTLFRLFVSGVTGSAVATTGVGRGSIFRSAMPHRLDAMK